MNKFKQTAIAAALAPAFVLGVAADAWAISSAGAKAWVTTQITDWSVTVSAGTVKCDQLISGDNIAAAFNSVPYETMSHSANPPDGLDPLQSFVGFVGTGTPPDQNTFSQTPGHADLATQDPGSNFFGRGDSVVYDRVGSDQVYDAASVVAESQVFATDDPVDPHPPGGANSNAVHRLNCELILTDSARVTIAFKALRNYEAFITSNPLISSGSAQITYNLSTSISQGGVSKFSWAPDGKQSSSNETDPFPLNGTIADVIMDDSGNSDYQPPGSEFLPPDQMPAQFSNTSPTLPAGKYSLAVSVSNSSAVVVSLGETPPVLALPVLGCAALNVQEAVAHHPQPTHTEVTVEDPEEYPGDENSDSVDDCENFVVTYRITCEGDLNLAALNDRLSPVGCTMDPPYQQGPEATFTINCPGPVSPLPPPGNILDIGYDTIWAGESGTCLLQLAHPFTCQGAETGATVTGNPGLCSSLISKEEEEEHGVPVSGPLGLTFALAGLALIGGLFSRRRQR